MGTNPGLLALWEDEKKRLQANGLDGEVKLDAPNSQGLLVDFTQTMCSL